MFQTFAYGVFQILAGNTASLGTSLSRGMRRFFSIVGTSVLIVLGIALGALLPLLPGVILHLPLLVILGALVDALLIPWFMCKWVIAIPACVVEHLGPIDSLSRSSELTKGYRLKILGLQSLAYILFLISLVVLVVIYGFLLSLIAPLITPFAGKALALLGLAVLLSLPMAFVNVTYTTIYYDLRSAKEGVSVESLANVFD